MDLFRRNPVDNVVGEPAVQDDLYRVAIIHSHLLPIDQSVNPRQELPGREALHIVSDIESASLFSVCEQPIFHVYTVNHYGEES